MDCLQEVAAKPKRAITTTSHQNLKKYDDQVSPGRLVAVGDWR